MPSKLEQLQQQYRRQLLQEKEERMIKIHTESQQKALSKVARYNGFSSVPTANSQPPVAASHHSPVKKGSPGVDRSRPLPPITKERNNVVAYRTSPVSAPTDNVTKVVTSISSRSRSVEFVESRQSPLKFAPQNELGNGSVRRFGDVTDSRQSPPRVQNEPSLSVQNEPSLFVQNEPSLSVHNEPSNATLRNGYTNVNEAEMPKPSQPAEPERRPDPETLARLKQAELQRLRAKTRDATPPRSNGVSGAISKSSTVQKKTPVVKPQATNVTTPRSRQTASRKPPVPSFRNAAAAPRAKAATPASAPHQSSASSSVGRKPPGPGQEQCRVCGRNFNADRIEKHASICAKTAQKKPKVFDATKMRVKGTEAEQFVRKGAIKTETPKGKKSDWRKKHNDFIEAIRQAKMVQQHLAKGGKVSDLPPPPPSDTSDYVPCPYCNRKFSESVADRHIPKCKNILSNKKNPPPRRK